MGQFLRRCLVSLLFLSIVVGIVFKLNTHKDDDVQKNFGRQELSEFEQYSQTVRELNGTTELIEMAKEIQNRYGLVMISIINDAFLPFTFSWMCNTKNMNIHERIIFITTDAYSKENLNRHWKKSKSVYIPSLHLHGNQSFSKVGYVKLMNLRTQLILQLLLENINVFLFETDCVWLSNPLPEIKSQMNSYDMLLVWQTRGTSVLGGFMVLKATKPTISLWAKLSTKMWELYKRIKLANENANVSKFENDQVYFTKLVKMKYANVKSGYLSNKKFSDGKWYGFTKKEQTKVVPMIINNNWITGNDKKIQRAKKWGHWFLMKDRKCDLNKISKVVRL